jgi:hypothetical protein
VYLEKADNDRLIGWNRMREYMKIQPDGKPLWVIFSTASNLIRTLPQMIHADKRVEDVADGLEDHAAESCRYALMSRPEAVPTISSNTSEWQPDAIESPFILTDDGFRHKSEVPQQDEDADWFKGAGW